MTYHEAYQYLYGKEDNPDEGSFPAAVDETGIPRDDEFYKGTMAEVDYGLSNMSFLLGESIVYAGAALVPALIAAIFGIVNYI